MANNSVMANSHYMAFTPNFQCTYYINTPIVNMASAVAPITNLTKYLISPI